MSAQDPNLPSRYEAVVPIGAGAFGEVYRATLDGRQVAVKVLAASLVDRPEVAWQFAAEYRQLARLEHPAFPAAVEEGLTADGRPFYAMAFVTGSALPEDRALPEGEVRRVLGALADALDYLHGRGYVHGDLKPENVRVEASGNLYLLDVGLMAPVGQKREAIAGTVEYLAPEVFRRAPVDPAADLYALGVLAYQLLAGRPPFRGAPADLVRAHLQTPPPPLRDGTPADLAGLVLALLAKQPEARPASALAVRAALGFDVAPERLAAAGRGLRAGRLVGREAALVAWNARLAQDPPEGGRWLTFAGAPGTGKSRLLEEARVAAAVAGWGWAGAACTGAGDAPGGPARALVRQALALAGRTADPIVAAWVAGEVPASLAELEPAARKALLHEAAAKALEASGADGLALGLDDWHRADAATRDFVAFMRARPAAKLAWALATDPAVLAPADGEPVAPVEPLAEADVVALVASRLGAAPPAALVEAIVPAAQGSPLVVDLVLEHLVGTGQLRADTAGWAYAPAAGGAPAGLAELWRARLETLGPVAARLAAIAAVASPAGALPAPALAAAAGLDDAALALAVEALAGAGLVATEGGRLRLALPGMAKAFEALAPEAARGGWATTLARGLVGAGTETSAVPVDVLVPAAWLALAGNDAALATRLGAEAGRRSLALGTPAEALRLLDAAAERATADAPAAERLAIALPRAEALRLLDRAKDAQPVYDEALALADAVGDAPAALTILNGRAKARQLVADYAGAAADLEAVEARGAAIGATAARVRAAVTEGRVRMFMGDMPAAMACGVRAVALARESGSPALTAQALNLEGLLITQSDHARLDQAIRLHEEALAISEGLGDRVGMLLALDNLGNAHLHGGHLGAAAEAFGRILVIGEAIGARTETLFAGLNLAIVAAERGDAAHAERLAVDVVRRATPLGRKFAIGAVTTARGQAAWRAGRPAEAEPHFQAALALASEIRNKLLEEHVRVYRLEGLLALGWIPEAAAEADALAAIVAATGNDDARARLACHQAELARQRHDLAGAREALAGVGAEASALARHRAHQIACQVALAEGDHAAAATAARAALAIAEDWDARWHLAHDQWLLARAALAAGDAAGAAAAARLALGFAVPAPDAPAAPAGHPYARVGAAWVLERAGAVAEGRAALGVALAALHTSLADLGERADSVWAAWELGDARTAAAPARTAAGGAIDPIDFQAHIEALAAAVGEEALGAAALEGVVALTGAERGYLLLYQEGQLVRAVTRAMDYEGEVAGGFSSSIASEALFRGEPIYVADASADEGWQAARSVMALGLRTVVALPLVTPERILGVLYVDRQSIEPILSAGDLALLGSLAAMASMGIGAARAGAALAAEAERARLCAEAGAAMARGLPAEAKLRAVLERALEASGARRALWLVRPGGSGLWRPAASLAADGTPAEGEVSQGIADWVARRGEPLSILDTQSAEDWQERRSVQALGLRTVWCVPGGSSDAVLYLDTTELVMGDPTAALPTLVALAAYAAEIL